MTDINQNFSLQVGNDTEVFFDLGPDDLGMNLEFVEALTWTAYPQMQGIPDLSMPLISKDVPSGGIMVTDPLLLQFTVNLAGADTDGLAGNFYHEVTIINQGALTTAATGLMTVIDPAVEPNVSAFKAMFSTFATVDDTTVQIALDMAGQFVDESWGDSQAVATMYLAAHFLSLASTSTKVSGRVVSSETIGPISRSYAVSSVAGTAAGPSGTLGQTTYGMIFDTMLTAQGYGIMVV
jgi:hypothetical protein